MFGAIVLPQEYWLKESCTTCGGSLEVIYDYKKIREKYHALPLIKGAEGIWKFSPLLPVKSPANYVSLGEGSTPYHKLEKIGSMLKMDSLFVKDESRNPTCSFKDRKSAVAISRAVEDGYNRVVAATAGNAGSSVAAYAAKAGIESYIFAFQGISNAKLAKSFGVPGERIPDECEYWRCLRIYQESLRRLPVAKLFCCVKIQSVCQGRSKNCGV